jgi:hypothetical protein
VVWVSPRVLATRLAPVSLRRSALVAMPASRPMAPAVSRLALEPMSVPVPLRRLAPVFALMLALGQGPVSPS